MAVPEKRKRPGGQDKSEPRTRFGGDARHQHDNTLCRPRKQGRQRPPQIQDEQAEGTTAVPKVLGTFELLEAVLVHLPPLQLYAVQRVRKNWCDVITTSLPLLQKLFIRTSTKLFKISEPHFMLPPVYVELNPLLGCHLSNKNDSARDAADDKYLTPYLEKNVLYPRGSFVKTLHSKALIAKFKQFPFGNGRAAEKSPWVFDRDGKLAGLHGGGFVSDPPTSRVGLYLHFKNPAINVFLMVYSREGVRLRDLFTQAVVDNQTISSRESTGQRVLTRHKNASLWEELDKACEGRLSEVEIDEEESCIMLSGCDMIPGCDNDMRQSKLAAFNPYR